MKEKTTSQEEAEERRKEVHYYFDPYLARQVISIKRRVLGQDDDYFWAVDGPEGSGKSVFAMQLAFFVDKTFDLSRVVFSAEDFRNAILNAEKGQAIVFDEAFRGLSNSSSLSKMNRLLRQMMQECRQKNLFVIVVLPTFFLLDKYVAIFRAKGLFHVYRPKGGEHKGQRGFWMYFNSEKKKLLYILGKKLYSYDRPSCNFNGRFFGKYALDEKSYRAKKAAALHSEDEQENPRRLADRYLEQRDALLWFIHKELKVPTTEMNRRFEAIGLKLSQSSISQAVNRKNDALNDEELLL